jgi:serine protease Do
VGRDVARGIVLLKVDPPFPLAAVGAAVPPADLAVGQWTIAVGRAWGPGTPNVAVGVLSATGRAWGRAVQTDASVSPANYGGPIVDIAGRVIGILAPLPADTAGMNLGTELYDSGIGFAVPLADILRVLPRLKEAAVLVPGLLGITYRSQDAFTAAPIIATVRAGSPAAAAGLRPGDTIVEASGRPVARIAELRHTIAPLYAGDAIDLVVERARKDATPERVAMSATLVDKLPPWHRAVIGIVPQRSAASRAKSDAPQPVVVGWVWPGSPAEKAGIAAGTILESITVGETGDPVVIDSRMALDGVLGGVDIGQPVTLTVKNQAGGQAQHRLVTMGMPTEIPATPSARPESPLGATVVKLEAPEIATPPQAVIPAGDKDDPVGVLVYFRPPQPKMNAGDTAAWMQMANRHGVAVILPTPADPQRWSRADIAGVARSIDSLRSRRAIDRSRVAVAGSGAGGGFAWLAAEALGPGVRGVAVLDAALPRQAKVEPAEPGQARWIVFGAGADALPRVEADRRRLAEAGHAVGMLPPRPDAAIPVETLARFVEALGLL